MKRFVLLLCLCFLMGCTHTIRMRSSHFNTPITSEKLFGGHFGAVGATPTTVTLINDITTNPPLRSEVKVNEDLKVSDLLLISNIGYDFSLGIGHSVELTASDSEYGVKWQFLNPGAKAGSVVGAVRAGLGSKTATTSTTSGDVECRASSSITLEQGGISFGYMVKESFVPYISYVNDSISVTTNVTNGFGAFNDYKDKGIHSITSLGFANGSPGFDYAIEYNMIDIKWDRADRKYQNSVGFKLGARW